MEQNNLYRVTNVGTVEQTQVNFYLCPSRRAGMGAANGGRALNDYCAATPIMDQSNIGNMDVNYWQGTVHGVVASNKTYFGVVTRTRSQGWKIKMSHITDGSSNVMVVAEKRLRPSEYNSGSWHDDQGWTDGWDPDTVRYTGFRPQQDTEQNPTNGYDFGSAHVSGMQALFADGSVHGVNYEIDLTLFNRLGDRRDGNVTNFPQ
jgi:hypothetical protein